MSHQEIHLWVSVRGLFSRAQRHKKWTGGLSATLQRGPDAPGLVRWSLELVLLGLQPVLRDSLTLQDTRHSPTHICRLCFVRQHMECGLTSASPQHAHSHTPHGVSSSGHQSSAPCPGFGATDCSLARSPTLPCAELCHCPDTAGRLRTANTSFAVCWWPFTTTYPLNRG